MARMGRQRRKYHFVAGSSGFSGSESLQQLHEHVEQRNHWAQLALGRGQIRSAWGSSLNQATHGGSGRHAITRNSSEPKCPSVGIGLFA
jgi:hypothetical protein